MNRKIELESKKTAGDMWTISSQAPKSKDMEKVQRSNRVIAQHNEENSSMNLSKKQTMQALIGMTLGDGYISKEGEFSVAHGMPQEEYLMMKYQILSKRFSIGAPVKVERNSTFGLQERVQFRTRCDRRLKTLRNLLYLPKKTAVRKALDRMGEIGLLFLWLDDGCLMTHRKRDGVSVSREFTLHVEGFEVSSVRTLKVWLYQKYDINAVVRNGHPTGFFLNLKSDGGRKLLKILHPFIQDSPDCMRYKLCPMYVSTRTHASSSLVDEYNLCGLSCCVLHDGQKCRIGINRERAIARSRIENDPKCQVSCQALTG